MVEEKLWTVARFPAGIWATGGKTSDSDYVGCEVWQVMAKSREQAKRKAQGIRSRAQRAAAQKGQP